MRGSEKKEVSGQLDNQGIGKLPVIGYQAFVQVAKIVKTGSTGKRANRVNPSLSGRHIVPSPKSGRKHLDNIEHF
jgi:hypothetical protein